MKNCHNILFDLDGTLIDSAPSITGILAEVLGEFGIAYDVDLSVFIGPPFQTAFPKVLGISEELTQKVIGVHRERYDDYGVLDFELFPGVYETLEALSRAGRKIYLVTSKLEPHARRQIEHARLVPFFTELYGQTEDGSRSHKDEVMEYAINDAKFDVNESVMVGDRHYDLNAANKFGMKSVGILHGYGSLEELSECRPAAIVNTMQELRELLI